MVARIAGGDGLVLVRSDDGDLVERRVHAWDRLMMRLRMAHLDRRLSRGDSPESDVVLALRAMDLVRPKVRKDLAQALQQVLALADGPTTTPQVRVCRSRVRAARNNVQDLRERLLVGGPVSAHGIAQVSALLSDGGGPLYHRSSRDHLGVRLRKARAALDALGVADR